MKNKRKRNPRKNLKTIRMMRKVRSRRRRKGRGVKKISGEVIVKRKSEMIFN